jgi:hypothetical protein
MTEGKIMAADLESELSTRSAKHVTIRPNGKLRNIEISRAALKLSRPQNEALKASMRRLLPLV